MKWKKLWKCIRSFINGMKRLNVQKRSVILMSKSLRKTTTIGYCKQVKKKKLQKSRKNKETITRLLLCISREESQLELQMLSTTQTSASLKTFSKR